jgi:hypothetical protein
MPAQSGEINMWHLRTIADSYSVALVFECSFRASTSP